MTMFQPASTASERLTIVVGTANNGPDWTTASVVHVETIQMMHIVLGTGDVERIILDRSISSDEFLHLLASLPAEVAGDVLLVRPAGGGFLSAIGRGGDRVLYAFAPHDLEFYLEMHGLMGGLTHFALTA
jgi:hypothetical protein